MHPVRLQSSIHALLGPEQDADGYVAESPVEVALDGKRKVRASLTFKQAGRSFEYSVSLYTEAHERKKEEEEKEKKNKTSIVSS